MWRKTPGLGEILLKLWHCYLGALLERLGYVGIFNGHQIGISVINTHFA
jgi:hypothetical protein